MTRLPAAKLSQDGSAKGGLEHSAREVSPAQLLRIQLVRANSLFLLHHAPTLAELFGRVGRETCCGLLERFWNKFARNWDVLLHGNPATAIYNATKLSGGGELGIGVGEEDWGSGEREVLEDFIDRTDGLRDLIVGRYGVPPETDRMPTTPSSKVDGTAWLGTGNEPIASDGVVFSGRGLISRPSLCNVSRWMEDIFKYGEDAYGVGDNPSSRPRRRPKRQKTSRTTSDESISPSHIQEIHPRLRSPKARAPNLRKQAIENNSLPPGIPAPLVSQVERSLDEALAKAAAKSPSNSPKKEKSQAQALSDKPSDDSSTFGAENMMKYLTLGYGTAWTLNPKGLTAGMSDPQPKTSQSSNHNTNDTSDIGKLPGEQGLQEVDPTPEVSEDEQPAFKQKLEQSIGRFLIGLSGDLEQTELETDNEDLRTPASSDQRLFLRTLNIEMARPKNLQRNTTIRSNSVHSRQSNKSNDGPKNPDPKTSASASVDGSMPNFTHEKVQVAVYAHQPFIFVFMFGLHTPSLTMPSFYRSIHHQLGPLQKPLLRSTDVSRVAARIAEATGERSSTSSSSSLLQTTNPIYDLTYDPVKMTVRTSIPNIPVPGSLAAEGLTSNTSSSLSISGSWYTLGIPVGNASSIITTNSTNSNLVKSAWSRTEALNVHTQILNTYTSTRASGEIENTVKTARGWWVLWMKVPDSTKGYSGQTHNDADKKISAKDKLVVTGSALHKEAFLVRKAADYRPNVSTQPRSISFGPGRWLLREQRRDPSGTNTNSAGGASTAKVVSEGVGVDAKRWVEGLLMLTS